MADHGWKRLGDVANPQANDFGLGMIVAKLPDSSTDFRKQITRLEFQVAVVDSCHEDAGFRGRRDCALQESTSRPSQP
jgi:hypothetical protein